MISNIFFFSAAQDMQKMTNGKREAGAGPRRAPNAKLSGASFALLVVTCRCRVSLLLSPRAVTY